MHTSIRQMEVFGIEMPLVGAFTSGGVTKAVTKCVIVRIVDDEGLVGISSIDPSTRAKSPHTAPEQALTLRESVLPQLKGLRTNNLAAITRRVRKLSRGQPGVAAAVELAVADLIANQRSISMLDLLGGGAREQVRFNGWIGELAPDEAAKEAAVWGERGFRSAKVKVGSGVDEDHDRIAAVRARVGSDFELRMDANEQYSLDGAMALERAVRGYDVALFEQPLNREDLAGLAKLRRSGTTPIMADESVVDHESLIRIIRADCADLVKFGIEQVGGLVRASQMLATARAAGLPVVLGHGFGLDLSTMAEILLGATCDNVVEGLECVGPLKVSDSVVTTPLDLRSGHMQIPNSIGLGLELDETKLLQYQAF